MNCSSIDIKQQLLLWCNFLADDARACKRLFDIRHISCRSHCGTCVSLKVKDVARKRNLGVCLTFTERMTFEEPNKIYRRQIIRKYAR